MSLFPFSFNRFWICHYLWSFRIIHYPNHHFHNTAITSNIHTTDLNFYNCWIHAQLIFSKKPIWATVQFASITDSQDCMSVLQQEGIIHFFSYVVMLQLWAKFKNTMASGKQVQRTGWLWSAVMKENLKKKIRLIISGQNLICAISKYTH